MCLPLPKGLPRKFSKYHYQGRGRTINLYMSLLGGVDPFSSPGRDDLPPFQDETDAVLGNDADVPAEEEGEGEELFGENFEA